jgi:hypothetical protein
LAKSEEKIATARLPMSVVLACQKHCMERAHESKAVEGKLFWLYTAFYVVVCAMAFLRPGELSKCTLYGMAGPGNDPVQVYRTGRAVYLEFLRLWTGFELPSSWVDLPGYGPNLNRNMFYALASGGRRRGIFDTKA